MREYTTQMDAARKGIITPELTKVAEKEHMREDELLPLVAEGKVVIPANKLHTCLNPEGIRAFGAEKTHGAHGGGQGYHPVQ